MGRLILRWLLATGFAAIGLQAAAVEQVSFPSADGKLQLTGQWFTAAGTNPRPAVLALDSFSPRGLGSICETAYNRRTVNDDDATDRAVQAQRPVAAKP